VPFIRFFDEPCEANLYPSTRESTKSFSPTKVLRMIYDDYERIWLSPSVIGVTSGFTFGEIHGAGQNLSCIWRGRS
jgi:hypothetical protein